MTDSAVNSLELAQDMAAIDADAGLQDQLASAPELLGVNLRHLLLQSRINGKPLTLAEAAGRIVSCPFPRGRARRKGRESPRRHSR